jgi:pyruvate dehydrogenase (quinone)
LRRNHKVNDDAPQKIAIDRAWDLYLTIYADVDAAQMCVDAHWRAQALLPRLKQKPAGKWRQTIENNIISWWKTLEDRAKQPANPVNAQRVVWELSPRLPERVIVTSDSGSCANWFARDLKMRRGMKASLSGGLASMGAAVPYAIAAKSLDPTGT